MARSSAIYGPPREALAVAERGEPAKPKALKHPWPKASVPGSWWRDHIRVAGESLGHVSRRLGTTLLAWLLVGIALALPAALYMGQSGLSELTGRWDHRPGLSVYLEPGTSPDALAAALRQRPSVQRVEVTTQDEAFAEFRAQAQFGDALGALASNPLPASLRVVPVAAAGPADLERLAQLVRRSAGTGEIVVEKTWLERMTAASVVAWRLGAILGALLGIGAILVSATAVRLAIEGRLEELKVMKLVGASNGQVRRPFMYLGVFYGFGGGVMAAMLLSLGLSLVEAPLAALLGSFDVQYEEAAFSVVFLAMLIGSGVVLGLAGAAIAVRQRQARLDIL